MVGVCWGQVGNCDTRRPGATRAMSCSCLVNLLGVEQLHERMPMSIAESRGPVRERPMTTARSRAACRFKRRLTGRTTQLVGRRGVELTNGSGGWERAEREREGAKGPKKELPQPAGRLSKECEPF